MAPNDDFVLFVFHIGVAHGEDIVGTPVKTQGVAGYEEVLFRVFCHDIAPALRVLEILAVNLYLRGADFRLLRADFCVSPQEGPLLAAGKACGHTVPRKTEGVRPREGRSGDKYNQKRTA